MFVIGRLEGAEKPGPGQMCLFIFLFSSFLPFFSSCFSSGLSYCSVSLSFSHLILQSWSISLLSPLLFSLCLQI